MALSLTLRRGSAESDTSQSDGTARTSGMGPATARAQLPAVNLLPASVSAAVRVHRIRRSLVAVAIGLVVVSGVAWYLQGSSIDQAQTLVTSAEEQNASLRAQVDSYAAVSHLQEAIVAQEKLVSTALASDPDAAGIVDRVRTAAGPDITLTQVAATYSGLPDPAAVLQGQAHLFSCPDPSPFTTKISVGCVSLSGSATTRAAISEFLARVDADPVLDGPFLESSVFVAASTEAPAHVDFTASFGISPAGLRTPLDQKAIDDLIERATPRPAATDPAATASPGAPAGQGTVTQGATP